MMGKIRSDSMSEKRGLLPFGQGVFFRPLDEKNPDPDEVERRIPFF